MPLVFAVLKLEKMPVDQAPLAAPWWGVPVIAGTFLLLGGVLSFLASRTNELAKQRRLESIRWDSDIRQLASEMISAAQILLKEHAWQSGYISGNNAALEILQNVFFEDEVRKHEIADIRAKVAELKKSPPMQISREKIDEEKQNIFAIQASLSFIAPTPVQRAAETLVSSVMRAMEELDTELLSERRKAVYGCMNDLTLRVREHLGVK